MAKRFSAQHTKNGFAAMGNNRARPRYKGLGGLTVAESIARERQKAARAANIKKK